MGDKTINVHNETVDETVFLSDMQEIKDNPYYGFLSDHFDINQLGREGAERYISSKDLARLQADLRRAELKERISDYVTTKTIAEKLLIIDFIKDGRIDPEKDSQSLYFFANLEKKATLGVDEENAKRIRILIGWAPYLAKQMDDIREKSGSDGWYLKISIKKNPTDNEFYIESIDAVKEKDS